MGKSTKDILKRMDSNIELILKHLNIQSNPPIKNKIEAKKSQKNSPVPSKPKAKPKQKK